MKHSTMSWCPAVSCLTYTSGTVKKSGITFLFLFFLSTLIMRAQVESPANDNCGDATQILCGQTLTGSTSNADADFPPFCEPNPFNSGNGANGVWYYHVGTGTEVTINMDFAGTDYDSYLNVYTGDCEDLVCVVGDDDSGEFAGPSIATFLAEQGVTYLIYVTGYGNDEFGNDGDYEFVISCQLVCEPSLTLECPADISLDCGADLSPVNTLFPTYTYVPCPGITGGDPVVEVSYSDDYISDGCPQIIARTWVAQIGNMVAMCTQLITLIDDEAPYFTYFPEDITLQCSQASTEDEVLAYLDANVPFPTFEDNCSSIEVGLEVVSVLSDNCPLIGTCTKTVTITDACGNSYSQTLTVTIIDTEGPVINGVDTAIEVQCTEDVPAPVDATAVDGCSGEETVEVFTSNTGEPNIVCDLTTAIGPGADWALWLPVLFTQGYTSSAQFIFDANGGHFVQFFDGSAHLYGTVVNTVNANEKFDVDFWFDNASDWATWSAMGRGYKDDLGCAQPNLFEDWTYYEMVNVVSTLTGQGDLAGDVLNFYHMPSDYYFGFQIGQGANNKNCDYGLSGWFTYTGLIDNHHVEGHGDVNVDADCQDGHLDDCPNLTEYTYFYHSIDDCDNATIVEQVITVNDTTAPEFLNCPADVYAQCVEGIPALAVGIEAVDNCTGDVIVEYLGEETEGDSCDMLITRTWVATDQCENRSYCIQHIHINDDTAPVFNNLPPSEITAECDNVPDAPELTATDNCDELVSVSFSAEIEEGECANDYYVNRHWIATDDCGNSTEFHQVLHVQDTTAPVIDLDVYIFLSCNEVEAFMPPVSDNCGEATIEITYQVLNSGGCMGVWQRIYTATDECGNTSTATQYISIQDNTPPVIVGVPGETTIECSDVTLQDDGNYCAPVQVYGEDDCGMPVTIDYLEQVVATDDDCPQSFDVVRTWIATDYCENQSTATSICHVVDTQAPTFEFVPEDITVECDQPIIFVDAVAYDLCGETTVDHSDVTTPGSCPQEWYITRTFTAEDECGNVATAQQLIHVVDTTAPVMEGDGEVSLECGEAIPYSEPSATDNCGEVEITYADYATVSPWFFYSTPGGNGYVDFSSLPSQITIGGSNGNFQTDVYTAAVTVAKQVEISFDWNYNTTDLDGSSFDPFGYVLNGVFVQLTTNGLDGAQSGSETILVPAGSVFAFVINSTDNTFGAASAVVSNISIEEAPIDCPIVDCILRQFTATDDCGNSSVFNQFIVTYDTTAPVFDAFTYDIELPCDNYGGIFVTATDVCSAVEITYDDEPVSGGCQGRIIRTYTATDACGNSATAEQMITLTDNVAPVASFDPEDFTVECGQFWDLLVPIFTDNCDNELFLDFNVEETTDSCTTWITYTWSATDNCYNTTSVEQTVTIVDTTNPEFVEVPGDITVQCNDEIPGVVLPLATDNCDDDVDVEFTEEVAAGDCPAEYTITRIFRAFDNCGNEAFTTQLVHVVDEEAPLFVGGFETLTVECDEAIPYEEPTAIDSCSTVVITHTDDVIYNTTCYGLVYRVFTATDACGNSSEFLQMITIVDTTAPVFDAYLYDIEMPCDNYEGIFVTATDNCSDSVSIWYDDEPVSGGCQGKIIRTYYASDSCQNVATTEQVITLTDNTAPVASYNPEDFTVECGSFWDLLIPIFTDNCDNELYLQSGNSDQTDGCTTWITFWWSATDNCGNTTLVDQVVTIVDTTAPEFTYVPVNFEVSCESVIILEGAEASDECDEDVDVSVTSVETPGSCPQNYTIERTFTATDNCGNTATATQIITVSDNEAPVMEGDGELGIECGDEIPYVEPTATDNCGEVEITYADYSTISPWFFYSTPGGNGYVDFSSLPSQITIGGSNGNFQTDVYTAAVTVAKQVEISFDWNYNTNDIDGSSFDPFGYILNGIFVQLTANDLDGAQSGSETILVPAGSVFAFAINSEDNTFGAASAVVSNITVEEAPIDCPIVDCILRQFTASDECGNSSVFNQFIVTYDTTEPVVDPYEVEVDMPCNAVEYTIGITASDACSEVEITFNDEFVSGTCQGHIIRDYVITDACGNEAYAQQIITLVDEIAPVWINPADNVVVECGNELPVYTPQFVDNCDNEITVLPASSIVQLDCGYQIHKTWVATDNCGNSTTAVFNITVVDTTAPVLSGEDSEFSIACNASVLLVAPTAEDVCDEEVEIVPAQEIIPGDCPNEYTDVFTWTAIDDCGNSSVRTIIVHHVDEVAPEFTYVPAGGQYSCDENFEFGMATATDNCGDVNISFEDSVVYFNCNYNYVIQRTWTATDECQNSNYATSYYYVSDYTAPEFDQDVTDVVVECVDEVPAIVELTATDNCGIATVTVDSDVTESGECGNQVILVSYTAVDECGNTAYTSYTITVYDNVAPVLEGCPEDLVLECDQMIPDTAVVTVSDNCDNDPELYFNEYVYGEVPVDGQEAACDLLTPSIADAGNCAAAYNNTSWAMWLGGMPTAYKYYVALEGSFEEFDNGTAHLQVTLANAYNPNGGFTADVWFYNGMDWTAWDNLANPTGFKADCNGLDVEHVNWTYYLLNNDAATLTGWGNYEGSFFTLSHAPSNNYFGYQVGLGANNVTPGYGSGGWFEYVGTLVDSSTETVINVQDLPGINNGGDFAFEHDCCPDYWVVREWCAVDCSGNWTCCSQTISFDGQQIIQAPVAPEFEPLVTAVKDNFDFVGISPNPANDHSVIEFTTKVNSYITMEAYDMSGRMVNKLFSSNVEAGQNYRVDFNTSSLEDGIYQVRLYSSDDSRVKKLIIER